MNWLCRFSIHKWTKWIAFERAATTNWFKQARKCDHCGITQIKKTWED